MSSDRTRLQWSYEPSDFFEAPYNAVPHNCELKIENGQVEVTLPTSCDPLVDEPVLLRTIQGHVTDLFAIRQLQVHRKYALKGPAVYRPAGGTVSTAASIRSSFEATAQLDCTVRDKDGNIKFDSREHRLATNTAMLNSLVTKLPQSPLLRRLFESYSRGVSDPSDEFLHLYEIRDAIQTHFGNSDAARRALGISKGEWNRFGGVANDSDIDQSRHRGKKGPGVGRPASPAELAEAREIAKRWIIAFSETV
jgi:hypothetical protein